MTLEERVIAIIEREFDKKVDAYTRMHDICDDSLEQVDLMVTLSSELGIDAGKFASAETVGELIEQLEGVAC